MRPPLLLIAVLLGAGVSGEAQAQTWLRVTVDYVTTASVYLSAGQAQGLFAADTLLTQRDTLAASPARLMILSSTRGRSVAQVLDTTLQVARGDTLFVQLHTRALQRLAEANKAPPPVSQPNGAPNEKRAPQKRRESNVSGRAGIEADVLRSWTRYGTGEHQVTENTYASPTLRLRLDVSDLPGRVRLRTNMRAAYYTGATHRANDLLLQVYQASAEAELPGGVHLQLGRFYSPYESHSGFWDGMLVRLGSNGVGGGVVLGYAPEWGNQSWSAASPKYTAFMDAHAHGKGWRYDVDVSAHQQHTIALGPRREFIGISQSFGYSRTYLTQRVQFGRAADGRLGLWQAHVTASTRVMGPLSMNVRYTTERNDQYFLSTVEGHRERWSAGAVVAGKAGFASAEYGRMDSGLGTRSATSSANFYVANLMGVAGVGFSGSMSTYGHTDMTYVAPYLERVSGRLRVRVGANYYRTDYGDLVFEQKGGDFTLALPIGARSELGLTASGNTGGSMTTARTAISFWQSF